MISVCMAVHNGEKYIKEQIDSILLQLVANDEIIISDDGSTDLTLEILETYCDSRIKLIHYQSPFRDTTTSSHELISANFENAIKHATGEYIFLADQDDIWLNSKVSIISNYLKNHDLVISDAFILSDGYCDNKTTWFKGNPPFRNYYLKKGKYHGCCMAFHRKMLPYILPFPKKLALHDTWIGLLIELHGQIKFIKEPLMYYRIHADNGSTHSSNTLATKIYYRINLLVHIYFRFIKNHCRSIKN